jgi:recombinational DNA repair protein (RecF pathway)
MEKIVREISEKSKKCSQCGRPHRIIHEIYVPKEFREKYQQMSCHLRFHPDYYLGSYEKDGFTWDVYSYPLRWKRIFMELGEKLKEPEKTKTNLEKYVEELYAVEEEEDE